MKTVLFACTHNAGRSQMAAALFQLIADPRKARAISAGTAPAQQVHPEVAVVMRELGVELNSAVPRFLTHEVAASADVLVTMGCGETCPVIVGKERQDWPLQDPKGQPLEAVRHIRDDIRARVAALVAARGWARVASI